MSILWGLLILCSVGFSLWNGTGPALSTAVAQGAQSGLTLAISLFIAIAPSLGFLGTVIGMIQAFDAIQAAGDISPNVVAGGMKVALITTVGGLIVAMILQVFYNYILAKIDTLSIDMENSSIELIDVLSNYKAK